MSEFFQTQHHTALLLLGLKYTILLADNGHALSSRQTMEHDTV
jgi:hypothetical protein